VMALPVTAGDLNLHSAGLNGSATAADYALSADTDYECREINGGTIADLAELVS